MPPRKKPDLPVYSGDDDTEDFALMVHTRLSKLRKSRDQHLQRVVSEASMTFQALRCQSTKEAQERIKTNREEHVNSVDSLMEIMEHKRTIEEQVVALMIDMCTRMDDAEAIIDGGLKGRVEEVQSILNDAEADNAPCNAECRMRVNGLQSKRG